MYKVLINLQFQSFTERIANIRINVAHRVEPIADSAEVSVVVIKF